MGVSTSLAVKIYKKYGDKSVDVVRAEPHRLASEVWGIVLTDEEESTPPSTTG